MYASFVLEIEIDKSMLRVVMVQLVCTSDLNIANAFHSAAKIAFNILITIAYASRIDILTHLACLTGKFHSKKFDRMQQQQLSA